MQRHLRSALETLFYIAQSQRNLLDDRKLHAKAGSNVSVPYMMHEKSAEPRQGASPSPKELQHRNQGVERRRTAVPPEQEPLTHADA